MILKIEESVKIEKLIDVEFPIYRKQILDYSTIYTKVESEKNQVQINVYNYDKKIEFEISEPYFWGSENYLLGKGEYKSSEEEFNKSLEKAQFFIGYLNDSLNDHKQVIKDFMETYIINLDENGSPKSSITDIMKLIDRASSLIGNER